MCVKIICICLTLIKGGIRMEFLKKYLEKRKNKKETRRREKFLNTKIPISELYICRLCIMNIAYNGIWQTESFKDQGYKLLKKVDEAGEDDYYIDVTTNTKYREPSSRYVKSGDVVVYQCHIPEFPRSFIEQQYITISDIIEMNEMLLNIQKKLKNKQ